MIAINSYDDETYAVEISQLLSVRFLFLVRVLKHVEFVDNVELGFLQVCQIVSLPSTLLFTSLIVLFHLHELHVDLVLNATLPAAHLSVVKGGQDAALGLLAGHRDGSDGVLSVMNDSINAGQEEVHLSFVRHWVAFHHANIDAAKAGSNGKVMATRAVDSTGELFILL